MILRIVVLRRRRGRGGGGRLSSWGSGLLVLGDQGDTLWDKHGNLVLGEFVFNGFLLDGLELDGGFQIARSTGPRGLHLLQKKFIFLFG